MFFSLWGEEAAYEKEMRRLCLSAKANDIPLEINFLGLHGNKHYPNQRFWKIAEEERCKVIFGADAHSPEAVWRPEVTKRAEEMVEKYGLRLQETIAFRKLV